MTKIINNDGDLFFAPEDGPDLTYEEVQDLDEALDEYLQLCLELYWQKVADGEFPWPEDGTEADIPDSTL